MSDEFYQGQWQAFDRVLSLLNSIDVPEGITPDKMRRHIYGLVHSLRPSGKFHDNSDRAV